MLKASIQIDLPSVETQRNMGPIDWVRSLFGAPIDLRSGKEELTVCAFSLIEGLIAGFASAGIDDVLSFLVDKQVVYVDTNDVSNDLRLIVRAAQAAGVLDRRFREMHLVLAHRDARRDASLHTIIDCKITSQVLVGEAEVQISLSSRLTDLQIQSGETAERYAERLQTFAAQPESFEPARLRLEQLAERIASSLGAALIGSKVARDEAVVQLIRPDRKQIGRFPQLGFGDQVQEPVYRPVPTLQRSGAYADPFYYYYHDPYNDYMNFVLVNSLLHQASWHSHHVHVVDPSGSALFSGESAAAHANDAWIGHDAVSYDGGGQLALSNSSVWDDDRNQSWLDTSSSASSCASTSSCSSSSSSCASASSCSSGSSCGSSCSSGSSCGSGSD